VWAGGLCGFVEATIRVVTNNPGAPLILWDYPEWGYSKLGLGKDIFGRENGPVFLRDHICEFFSREFTVVAS
jgi:hypothetical protein